MVIDDFNLVCVAGPIYKTNAIFLIYPDTPLPEPITFQLLKPVPWQNSQKCDFGSCVNH